MSLSRLAKQQQEDKINTKKQEPATSSTSTTRQERQPIPFDAHKVQTYDSLFSTTQHKEQMRMFIKQFATAATWEMLTQRYDL